MTATTPVGVRPDWVDDELYPFESRFVELGGNVVHYVDEGSGPILLLLTGNPAWSFVYREVIAELRDRFRCIAVDFPGFGLSATAQDFGYGAQDHAEVVATFVEQLDLSGVTLVGHSWGGPLGLYAAERQPERFDRLVLSNTWACPLNGDPSSEFFSRGIGNAAGRALLRRTNVLVTKFIPSAHKRRKVTDAEMAHYREALPTPASRRASAAMPGQIVGARAFFTELEGGLASLADLPTLILWADGDPIFTAKYRKRWESIYPGATTTVVEGAGHFLQSDAPKEFSHAIETWWAGVEPEAK